MATGYLGEIRIWPMASQGGAKIPVNWLECNGALLTISAYEALYSVIGTVYGGDGTTTFALPDLRDRVPIHMGTGTGLSPRAIGNSGGADTVTLQTAELPAHTHTFLAATTPGATNTLAANSLPSALPDGIGLYSSTVTAPVETVAPPSSAGGGQSHDNVMPSMTLTYMMCILGEYPVRP